jgi:hypothetical protein
VPTGAAPTGPNRLEERADGAVPAGQLGGGSGDPLPQLLAGAGIVLLLAALAGAPAGVRALQRRRRLAAGTAGAFWDELTATAVDLGLPLNPAWTPRQTARELSTVMRRAGEGPGGPATDAVLRLALAEETASYGRAADPPAHPDLAGAVRTTRRALLAATGRRGRLRAVLWPASLVMSVRTGLTTALRRRTGAVRLVRRRHRAV